MSRLTTPRFVLALVALALAAGCAEKSPIERMEAIRAEYSASLNGFVVKAPEPEPMDEVDAEADTEEVGEVDDELAAALAAEAVTGPVASNILLDFVVRTNSDETLPGVTVDVTMGNAAGEKERWEVWIDSSELTPRGPGMQLTHELEGVMYEEGDGFHVEVRHPIPEEERNTYREYADAG